MSTSASHPGTTLEDWLAQATVAPEITALRPDYRALLIVAEGLVPGPSDEVSERLLAGAERTVTERYAEGSYEDDPHVLAWRDAFKAAGMKPKRTRPSADALLRRVPAGLPRINRLTDIYNAVSIAHAVPLGGEDLDHYRGVPRLARAVGDEEFVTTAGGEPVVESPEPGEPVWRDDLGVTCRRWNWRQCTRTQLTLSTTRAFFVLDALGAMDDAALAAAGDALVRGLVEASPGARTATRLVAA
ncbi:phenylalanine--tRNA ligase beta subunit-related protein [Streptomyces sp. DSM 44915]|uniref:Phenylalanine--tRNA ligase beta subunit-related protein n=1 Tax=Streptomyces chisholmiae TaxID=3075540 RepID=A0ABU2JUP9_9ACTN|nr:phenylalanine--tRNA ligase beta subunit-related protein [Streptomyces sp. DSM 44915]MDT0268468.1 phenylalanine--tRNA ligase beta subunit-related protein [Streptomyces sp. DSM 44915]